MDIKVIFTGRASATLRWLLKAVKSQDLMTKFTIDDLTSTPTTTVSMPMRTSSGEFVGNLKLDFIFEMPSPDAFILLEYDVLCLVDDSAKSKQWKILNIAESRGADAHSIFVENPPAGSQIPVGLRIGRNEIVSFTSVNHLMGEIARKTLAKRMQLLKASQTTAEPEDTTNAAVASNAVDDETK